ncbi:MAG: protein kinase [Candidatus Aminicenantes bacterium]|nr:protein kinase [Candidatus Aminicenantes bacterium]
MLLECPNCHHENPQRTNFCGKCATPLPNLDHVFSRQTQTIETPREELTTGSTFAKRYTIIEELGKGGMGHVYKASDTELGEKVALKLINPKIAADKKTIERFRNELKLARKIRHKNVCQMYDLNKENEKYYITMEYVSGEDLKSFIRRSRELSIKGAISIARQVCEGLIEAHKHGVIHRDLKPSNIMIDRDGNVRIMDFGIARSLKSKGLTGVGIMIGTPEYLSPEQADGEDIDGRSDIYSLGVILYEIVTGQLPFQGDTPLSLAVKHRIEKPGNPRTINPQIPEVLSQIILKCLEKKKEDRYPTAENLLEELKNIDIKIPSTEHAIPRRKPTTSKEITVSFSLKKMLIPALIFATVVAAGLLTWQLFLKGKTVSALSDKPSVCVLYFQNNSGDTSLDYLRRAIPELMITDLAESEYVRVLRLDEITSLLQSLNMDEDQTYSIEDIQELARRRGINHVIRGSYTKLGEIIRITTTLIDGESGETTLSISAQAEGPQDLSLRLDDLAKEIKAKIDVPPEQWAVDEAIEGLELKAAPQKK